MVATGALVFLLVLFFMVLEFTATASFMSGTGASGVAHIAHLSGALIGYFYLRRFMDLKAWYLKAKMRRLKKPAKVIRIDRDDDERGPWLH